jgi:hypothetical protein
VSENETSANLAPYLTINRRTELAPLEVTTMPKNDDDKHYVVKYLIFKSPDPSHDWTYAPDGEAYECTRETALARFEALIAAGKLGAPVFGLVPFHVRIEDTRIAKPKGKEPMRNVMLSQYVPDDYALGPWADERAAA